MRVGNRRDISCDDCYFRQAGLCALSPDRPCPTFRHVSRGNLVPPRQPRLIARTRGGRFADHLAA
jgi:hypothetical protein